MLRVWHSNKKQLVWMIVLLTTAIVVSVYEIGGLVWMPPPALPGPTTNIASLKKLSGLQEPNPEKRLHFDVAPLEQRYMFKTGGRNIFRMQETGSNLKKSSALPPVNPDGPRFVKGPSVVIPFKFYGFADNADEVRRIFLQDNGEVFVARLGDTVERRYKVIGVSPKDVTIQDVLNNYSQRIPLTSQ